MILLPPTMTEKCDICLLDTSNDSIACDLCDTWYHYSYTNLSPFEFQSFCSDPTLSWTCSVCVDNTHCIKCNIGFNLNSNQKSICCHLCKKYFHLKCSHLTLAKYSLLSTSNEKWYCRTCTNSIFPFNNLDNNKFLKLWKQNTHNKTTPALLYKLILIALLV